MHFVPMGGKIMLIERPMKAELSYILIAKFILKANPNLVNRSTRGRYNNMSPFI